MVWKQLDAADQKYVVIIIFLSHGLVANGQCSHIVVRGVHLHQEVQLGNLHLDQELLRRINQLRDPQQIPEQTEQRLQHESQPQPQQPAPNNTQQLLQEAKERVQQQQQQQHQIQLQTQIQTQTQKALEQVQHSLQQAQHQKQGAHSPQNIIISNLAVRNQQIRLFFTFGLNLITKIIDQILFILFIYLFAVAGTSDVEQQRRDIKRRISTIEQPGQKLARMNDSPTGITKNV